MLIVYFNTVKSLYKSLKNSSLTVFVLYKTKTKISYQDITYISSYNAVLIYNKKIKIPDFQKKIIKFCPFCIKLMGIICKSNTILTATLNCIIKNRNNLKPMIKRIKLRKYNDKNIIIITKNK